MFSHASLRFKLISAFSFVALFLVVIAANGIYSMGAVQTEYDYIGRVLMDNMQKVNEINDNAHDAHRNNFRIYVSSLTGETERLEKAIKTYHEHVEAIQKIDADYRSTPFAPGEKELYENLWASWKKYDAVTAKFHQAAKAGDKDLARQYNENELVGARADLKKETQSLLALQKKISQEKMGDATETYTASRLISLILSAIGIGAALFIGFFFSGSITKTVTSIATEIMTSSEQTSQASQELTSASSQLSQGATESAASLEETVSSLEELSSMVKLNSDHAKEANSLSQRSLSSAEQGEKEIEKLISAMSDMAKSSKKIEEIINVIDDIAFQTNLLALNAAVEAARAGEQGKGFAVVADAVRNLAQRSAVAAKDINVLIKENVEKTVEGSSIADTSGASLKEIVTSAKKVADLNSEISAASQEQANGIEQISKAMNHLDSAIQGNASSSEEVASSAEEMSSQSRCLVQLVNDLKGFVDGKREGRSTYAETPTYETKSANVRHFPGKKPMTTKSAHSKLPLDDKEASIGKAEGF